MCQVYRKGNTGEVAENKCYHLFQNGDTALHIAAAMGRRKLTKILLESGADQAIKNKVRNPLILSPAHSPLAFVHLLNNSLTHKLIHSLTCLLTHTLMFVHEPSPTQSLTHLFFYTLVCFCTRHTHTLTNSLTSFC